jgi:hypothetical protein
MSLFASISALQALCVSFKPLHRISWAGLNVGAIGCPTSIASSTSISDGVESIGEIVLGGSGVGSRRRRLIALDVERINTVIVLLMCLDSVWDLLVGSRQYS